MFTVILSNSLWLDNQNSIEAALENKDERGLYGVHSDESKLGRNTVAKDVGLSW
jgi:hypothetical protein